MGSTSLIVHDFPITIIYRQIFFEKDVRPSLTFCATARRLVLEPLCVAAQPRVESHAWGLRA